MSEHLINPKLFKRIRELVMQVKTVAKKSRDEQTLYTNIFCDLDLLI